MRFEATWAQQWDHFQHWSGIVMENLSHHYKRQLSSTSLLCPQHVMSSKVQQAISSLMKHVFDDALLCDYIFPTLSFVIPTFQLRLFLFEFPSKECTIATHITYIYTWKQYENTKYVDNSNSTHGCKIVSYVPMTCHEWVLCVIISYRKE